MNRWWDDPTAALAVLERVDDSDVVQGVGTAVLGFHAIAKAAVAPLAETTLVDPVHVHDAFADIDMEPVAKALARATESVIGKAASERYGQLLALDMHTSARAGAAQAMTTLVAKGVPAPVAVRRVAEGAGLPLERIGTYVEAMAKPGGMPDLVVADAADRALMEYASRTGHREAIPHLEPVGKAAAEAFDESEHRRDQQGRFAAKPRAARPKRERAAAQARQIGLVEQVKARADAVSSARSLNDLVAALRPAQQRVAEPRVAQRVAGRVSGRTSARVAAAPEQDEDRELSVGQAAWKASPKAGYTFGAWMTREQLYDLQDLDEFHRDFSTADLLTAMGGHPQFRAYKTNEGLKAGDIPPEVLSGGAQLGDLVFVEIDGDLAIDADESSDPYTGEGLFAHDRALFTFVEGSEGAREMGSAVPGRAASVQTIRMRMKNPDSFDYIEVFKAVEAWQTDRGTVHRLVNRDEGRFAPSGGITRSQVARSRPKRDRAARQARHLAVVEQAKPRQGSLADLARRAPAQRVAEPRVAQRVAGRVAQRTSQRSDTAMTPLEKELAQQVVAISADDFRVLVGADERVQWLDEIVIGDDFVMPVSRAVLGKAQNESLEQSLATWADAGSPGKMKMLTKVFGTHEAAASAIEAMEREDAHGPFAHDYEVVREGKNAFQIYAKDRPEPRFIIRDSSGRDMAIGDLAALGSVEARFKAITTSGELLGDGSEAPVVVIEVNPRQDRD